MKNSVQCFIGILLAALLCFALPAFGGNIIGFADNATSCGGATLCSTNGTTGYSGTEAFNLSTINSWFQIDTTGTSYLAGQPVEPNGGAGDFLVINDTGAVVTSFSLTLNDTFTAAGCSGSPVDMCNFQIHGGAANYFSNLTLNGPNCVSGCGTDSANFSPGTVTYTWTAGTDGGVPIGATFDLNFASWNNSVYSTVPEGSSIPMLAASGLVLLGAINMKRRLAA